MLTGLILAMARAAGEVAPLMIVGMVKLAPALPVDGNFPFVHLERKFMHLGFHIYDVGFQSPNVEAEAGDWGSLRIETVHDGDILGWSCFLPPLRWRFDARAIAPVRTLALDAECLRRKLEEDHEFGFQILKRLTLKIEARFQAARYQLLDVYGSSTEKGTGRDSR